ncbi:MULTISPECIES: SCO6880 family protein [Bifidobacterium]|jgi:hypothetical protein|uniref:Integral membrane protein n=1 Tax=Bifidobacterium mongoliense TaxID=518643 RepID=A0A423UC31_9BIFI|nr:MULTISPECIES: SCO6880 family protein [Bifidobacterium]MCI1225385.1 hypothetical protein [Bifidobacterium sp.]ROT86269.1 hypothetical protein BMONG18_1589 [Bifidobacterium mongoliense]
MNDKDKAAAPRTYGNWIQPTTPGIIPGIGTLGSALFFIGIFVALPFVFANDWITAIAVFAIDIGIVALISRRDKYGKSLGSKLVVAFGWWRSQRKKENMYRAGALGYSPFGSVLLPGILAKSSLSEGHDGTDRPFALLRVPRQHTYTIVLEASPAGEDLVDQEQIDTWVARWGQLQADMADEPGLTHFSATIETLPANPLQLRQEVLSNQDSTAASFSVKVLNDIVATYPQGSSAVKAYLAFSYTDRSRRGGRRRREQEMMGEIATRITYLCQKIQQTGAGACIPLTAQELCRYVRIAYDPATAASFDEAAAYGQPIDLQWDNCGPMASQSSWSDYRHDSGRSVTWEMTTAPRGLVQSNILTRLLSPQSNVLRKRVTWLYRPVPADKTPDVIDSDVNAADYAVNSMKKPPERLKRRKRAADQTASEEASGAGLANFSCLVTVTMGEASDKADVMASVEALGSAARIRLRPVYGSQDSAFAAALPLGLNMRQFTAVPAEYSDKL